MNKNACILVTGGTGSFGRRFVDMTLKKFDPRRIIIYSRDEMKQWEMKESLLGDRRLVFKIGDVRDKERLNQALIDVDYVVHAAATKIVPTAEYNPGECVKTNIIGAMNLIDTAISRKVKKVVALSTDKACNPVNLYGATKLASDKLFIAANAVSENLQTKFSIVRYGNVMGSRGSVIPYFMSLAKGSTIPITDPRMTRFMITLEGAVEVVWLSLQDMIGGEIYVKKIPSMNIMDIAKAVAPDSKVRIIGIRPGEKIHEQMISAEDAPYTRSYKGFYKILPMLHDWHEDPGRIKDGVLVSEGFSYDSGSNLDTMTVATLRNWLMANSQSFSRPL